MNAIEQISAALGYDEVESAIRVSFALACAIAAKKVADAAFDNDASPESFAPTTLDTVRPGKFSATKK